MHFDWRRQWILLSGKPYCSLGTSLKLCYRLNALQNVTLVRPYHVMANGRPGWNGKAESVPKIVVLERKFDDEIALANAAWASPVRAKATTLW